jgi:hypothetical protein
VNIFTRDETLLIGYVSHSSYSKKKNYDKDNRVSEDVASVEIFVANLYFYRKTKKLAYETGIICVC